MDDKERKLLQQAMEIQFRHKLYCDIKFPYLQSLGIKDIVQAVSYTHLTLPTTPYV